MFTALRASSSRLPTPRLFSTTARVLKKPLRPTLAAPTPESLLAKIGRNADTKLAEFTASWEKLNQEAWMDTKGVKSSGLSVKDKRYILWAFNKYSLGNDLASFVRPVKPPKKFRGWGHKIQHGVRVRD
ncbi:hypothetical protein IAT38_003474 [Cryptococcus sp. DSM 104549]